MQGGKIFKTLKKLMMQYNLKFLSKKSFYIKKIFPKYCNNNGLKVVPTTFLLVCFVCLKERTCEKRKNVFYFTWKALFVLEIIKF